MGQEVGVPVDAPRYPHRLGRARLFSWKTQAPLAVLHLHTASVTCVDFAHTAAPFGGGMLATGSRDSRIAVYSLYPPK